jgi:hypothetical protein
VAGWVACWLGVGPLTVNCDVGGWCPAGWPVVEHLVAVCGDVEMWVGVTAVVWCADNTVWCCSAACLACWLMMYPDKIMTDELGGPSWMLAHCWQSCLPVMLLLTWLVPLPGCLDDASVSYVIVAWSWTDVLGDGWTVVGLVCWSGMC